MRVLTVVHGETERAETFGDVVREHGHELVEWKLPERGRPDVDADAVMLFGGAQNVGEEDRYPWLEDEYELLRGWVEDGTPVLGVCLGAQTLAHAVGGRVAKLDEPQVGIREVTPTEDGKRDPVLSVLLETFDGLFSCSYGFDVPPGAVATATTDGRTQAFRVRERAWGLAFHPEVRRAQVLHWWDRRSWLPKPLEELERDLDEHLAGIQRDGRAICSAFLQ